MRITIFQQDILWDSPEENIKKADRAIGNGGSDLYVLPEMFATGFLTDGTAPAMGGEALAWMHRKAVAVKAAIAGSLAWEEDGKRYNRFIFVKPNGETATYDKRHLFAYGGENKYYTAGEKRTIVEYGGFRILLQVCYDLRFPVFSRNRQDYDLVLYVANWPASRSEVWKNLLRARAIENQCYVVGVNRTGRDKLCAYSGESAIIDAYGRTLVECKADTEGIATAEIEIEVLEAFRNKFPVWADADNFALNL